MIAPSQPVVTLIDVSKVRLVAGVTENKVPLLKEGQVVEIQVMAIKNESSSQSNEKIFGSVTVVPPAADRVTRLFNVEIEINNVDQGRGDWLLKPGMIASANVYVKDDPALAIPADAAIRVADGKVWAYFVRDGYQAGLSLGALGQH